MKNTNTQLKYSLYWLLLGLVDSFVQHEEVVSILQNAFFKSKLLKLMDSAIVLHEEVNSKSFTIHSTNTSIKAAC